MKDYLKHVCGWMKTLCLLFLLLSLFGCFTRREKLPEQRKSISLKFIRGADWLPNAIGFDPRLPGFRIRGDIGEIEVNLRGYNLQDSLVLEIYTSPGIPPMLEHFRIYSPVFSIKTEPFKPGGLVQIQKINSDGNEKFPDSLEAKIYFRFKIIPGGVRVTLLEPVFREFNNSCRIHWIDYYR